ncbi:ECF transporter S component [Nocardioides sp. GY 10127]|uniref:ECF transporter S component n=1 Tax=Nocardioides sp. GY 10127 TaxID=2569762 RepID=UPI0010A91555|nr:ECF transporter S component [Nocardioides sp. GY 10127]TIC80736.1 ECF transporter S component [Nocardioides sp. GY 10127]
MSTDKASISPAPTDQPGRWDPLVLGLQDLRRRSGEPSFNEIARRIGRARVEAGADAYAAHVGKSTVHDAFRLGRTRLNLDLVREVVTVLGHDPALVEDWLNPQPPAPTDTVAGRDEPAPGPDTDPGTHAQETTGPVSGIDPRDAVVLMLACLLLNLLGRTFVDFFRFPVYLDMVGTAIAAIALGPWRGAAVGLGTNLIGFLISGWASVPLAVVNVAGALLWGYGTHRFGLGRSLPRYFGLNVATAVMCTALAVPILLALDGQQLRDGHDMVTALVDDRVNPFVLATTFSNLLTSLADKLISGFVALVVVLSLPAAFGRAIGPGLGGGRHSGRTSTA